MRYRRIIPSVLPTVKAWVGPSIPADYDGSAWRIIRRIRPAVPWNAIVKAGLSDRCGTTRAKSSLNPNLPKYSVEDLLEGYRWIAGELNRYGITTAFEAAIRNVMETIAWQRLRLEQPLPLRVVLGPYPVYGDKWEANTTGGKMFDTGFATGFGDGWLKFGAVQIGIDGGVIGQTAALSKPYSNDPTGTQYGSFRLDQDAANQLMLKVHSNNWQAGLICHGDRGIMRGLDAVAYAREQAPNRDLRHRLEHAYLWNPEAMDRMAELGVIWNTQPVLMEIVGREGVYGQWGERARFAFPFNP